MPQMGFFPYNWIGGVRHVGIIRGCHFPAGARNKSSPERPRGSSTSNPQANRPPFSSRSCLRQSQSPPPCRSRICRWFLLTWTDSRSRPQSPQYAVAASGATSAEQSQSAIWSPTQSPLGANRNFDQRRADGPRRSRAARLTQTRPVTRAFAPAPSSSFSAAFSATSPAGRESPKGGFFRNDEAEDDQNRLPFKQSFGGTQSVEVAAFVNEANVWHLGKV